MSNKTKDRLLGQSFGAASNRLRKMILFDLLRRFDLDWCFQCGERIEDVDDLSIEHKEPWQGADDPKAAFFDLENIAFSHLRCNIGAAEKPHKKYPNDRERKRVGFAHYYERNSAGFLRRKRERYRRNKKK